MFIRPIDQGFLLSLYYLCVSFGFVHTFKFVACRCRLLPRIDTISVMTLDNCLDYLVYDRHQYSVRSDRGDVTRLATWFSMLYLLLPEASSLSECVQRISVTGTL